MFSFKMQTEISALWFSVVAYLLFPSQWLIYVSFLKLLVIVHSLDKKAEESPAFASYQPLDLLCVKWMQ